MGSVPEPSDDGNPEQPGAPAVQGEQFAMVPEWLIDAEVSDRAIRLWCILHRHIGRNDTVWPYRRTLAERLRCSEDTVDRATKELVTAGAVQVERRKMDDGTWGSNVYWLWPKRPEGSPHPRGEVAAPVRGRGRTSADSGKRVIEREPKKEINDVPPDGETTPALRLVGDTAVDTTDPVTALVEHLADCVAQHRGSRPKVNRTWSRDMDLLLRRGPLHVAVLEPIRPDQVRRVIDYVFSELATPEGTRGFCWADQIRSASALRDHWLQIRQTYLSRARASHARDPLGTNPDGSRRDLDLDNQAKWSL